jgi:hypothetical protein
MNGVSALMSGMAQSAGSSATALLMLGKTMDLQKSESSELLASLPTPGSLDPNVGRSVNFYA